MTWYALTCNPKCERRAQAGLSEEGIENYLPWGRIWSKPRRATGVVMRLRPAFPRYIFVDIKRDADWWSVRRVNGVEGVVTAAYVPLAIPARDIDRVRKAEDEGILDFGKEPKSWKGGEYQKGQELKIIDGPFSGFLGTVVRSSTKKGVDIETMLFGRTAITTVPLDAVKVAA